MAQESSNDRKVAQPVPGTDADSDDDKPLVPTKLKTSLAEDDDDVPLAPTNAPSAARSTASSSAASASVPEKKTAGRKRPREHKTTLPKEKKAKHAAGGLSCPHSAKIDGAAAESKSKCCGCGARACELCRKQWARCECVRQLCLKCKSASRWRCAGSGCDVYFGACKNHGSLTLNRISHNCRMCFEAILCVNCLIECEGYCAACERGVDMILGGLNG